MYSRPVPGTPVRRVLQRLSRGNPNSGDQSSQALPRWTVLKYCISDTNMADSVTKSVRPFAETKINSDLRVVVQHCGLRAIETLPNTDMGKAASMPAKMGENLPDVAGLSVLMPLPPRIPGGLAPFSSVFRKATRLKRRPSL